MIAKEDNVLWRTDITDMTGEVQGLANVAEATPAQEARKRERDETATKDSGGLDASQHVGATQDGEPEERQLQQQPQPKPKLKLQLKWQPELQQEPKCKPTPTLARRWETLQP